jgi:hypothetical protein
MVGELTQMNMHHLGLPTFSLVTTFKAKIICRFLGLYIDNLSMLDATPIYEL